MPINHSEIASLLNGVSQQADKLRFSSQGSSQENAVSSTVGGLGKRPPMEYVAQLYDETVDLSNAFFHYVSRDSDEQYLVVVRGGATPIVEAWDLEGNAVTVTDSTGGSLDTAEKAYLATSTPKTSLKALTVGDTTFILNKDKTVEKSSDLSTTSTPEALVFIKNVTSSAVVGIDLRNTEGGSVDYSITYNPASGNNQQDVAAGLVSALDSASANAVYTYSAENGVIHIRKTDNSEFGITVTDETGGNAYGIKDKVAALSDLPSQAYVGFQVQIDGDAESDQDNSYYVEYKSAEDSITSGFHNGKWEEVVNGGINTDFDEDLMPHKLVSDGSTFAFGPIDWTSRAAGDDDSNPFPSFTNNVIDDIFFFKNRFGILARENAVFSEDGQFFNFFKTTVVNLLDTDPIDVTVGGSAEDVVFLRNAVPREGELLVFADDLQFTITSEGAFTPASVSATLVGRTAADKAVKPIPLDTSFYFPFTRGSFSGITEYFRTDQFQPFIAQEITEHVPNYISGSVEWMVGNSAQNIMVVKADDNDDTLYIYNFLDQGTRRIQSAWSKFTFNGSIRRAFFEGSVLYMLNEYADQVALLKINLEHGHVDTGLDFTVAMDRRITQAEATSWTYDAETMVTTATLPYTPTTSSEVQVVNSSTGEVLSGVSWSGTTLSIPGADYTSTNLFIGERYDMSYGTTRPYMRQGDPPAVVSNLKFFVKNLIVEYDNTSVFTVEVANTDMPSYTYEFDSRNLGSSESILGSIPSLEDGNHMFPILDDSRFVNVTLKNTTPLPCNFTSLVWEGTVYRRR